MAKDSSVRVLGNSRSVVSFPWGTIPIGGKRVWTLNSSQLEMLKVLYSNQDLSNPRFHYEIIDIDGGVSESSTGDAANPSVVEVSPTKESVSADSWSKYSRDELEKLYLETFNKPAGRKQTRTLIKELQKAYGNG